jgi:hypothetical protein
MPGPISVKSPNNISEWQMEFNSAFKGLKQTILLEEIRAGILKSDQITPEICTLGKLRINFMLWSVEIRVFVIFIPLST